MGLAIEHGGRVLRSVTIDDYNSELRDGEGFLGDRANKRAFKAIIDNWRRRLRRSDGDPFDGRTTDALYQNKQELERILIAGDAEAAGVLMGALDEFAHELAAVIHRLLDTDPWRATQAIAIGGGFREGRIGELMIGRAAALLKREGVAASLVPLRHHPDEAGLVGGIHLAPAAMVEGFRGILAVDLGGTNLRTGIVEHELGAGGDIIAVSARHCEQWRHADEKPDREGVIGGMIGRLERAVAAAEREDFALAPFIAIGCPGVIGSDGVLLRGSQNLPGNWEGFALADDVTRRLPRIRGRDSVVCLHNDAVMQGLSELPAMRGLAHWGVLTIGTGLGNARFTNRPLSSAYFSLDPE